VLIAAFHEKGGELEEEQCKNQSTERGIAIAKL
jgi:hypothetical protein